MGVSELRVERRTALGTLLVRDRHREVALGTERQIARALTHEYE